MPRKRMPEHIMELQGSYIKNPHLRKLREGTPQNLPSIGECPSHLNDQEQICWNELVDCTPPGVLTKADRIVLELTAGLLAASRKIGVAEIKGDKLNLLYRCLSSLGNTPADRNRVSINQTSGKNNPFLND